MGSHVLRAFAMQLQKPGFSLSFPVLLFTGLSESHKKHFRKIFIFEIFTEIRRHVPIYVKIG